MPIADSFAVDSVSNAIALRPVVRDKLDGLPPFAQAAGFTGAAGSLCLLPKPDGSGIAEVLVGIGDGSDRFALGDLPRKLPKGIYTMAGTEVDPTALALAWALGSYTFDRYKQSDPITATLVWPPGVNCDEVLRTAHAVALVRDLVNTPADDLGPEELQFAAREVADMHGAIMSVMVGEHLLTANFPLIYAVGRASPRPPRLIDLIWGEQDHPQVTLIGKGVCFDTGGLDLKPASGMRLMKKDMGGAAHALALAQMIMQADLPVRLRVLIPAVDNAVAGNAMRPGDIFKSRSGQTVEISNTDAEGRLILADVLTEAASQNPAVIIDFATLTGAARVALGPELPALFCNNDVLADALLTAAKREADPLWRLPLWPGYRSQVESQIADLDNAPEGGMAGAITAALFLERFVPESVLWAHIDTFAWNSKARPGRPVGGEALGLRAVFAALEAAFTGENPKAFTETPPAP